MLPLLIVTVFVAVFPGVSALYCPRYRKNSANVINGFTDGGDGSCYSEVNDGYNRDAVYSACENFYSTLPVVTNPAENQAVQQKALRGIAFEGHQLPGIWLGLVCMGNEFSYCKWDDGTRLTEDSYCNFDRAHPNATLGNCVYLDAASGFWRSESCSNRYDIGYYCTFTSRNYKFFAFLALYVYI